MPHACLLWFKCTRVLRWPGCFDSSWPLSRRTLRVYYHIYVRLEHEESTLFAAAEHSSAYAYHNTTTPWNSLPIMTRTEQPRLPPTHRALVVNSVRKPLDITVNPAHPTPQPTPGSVVIRVLGAAVMPYAGEIYSGVRPYPFPTPLVPGFAAVGRVVATGPDAVLLRPGDLVWADPYVHARDEDTATLILGTLEGLTPGGKLLMRGPLWADGTYAEFARLPLENLHVLNETTLLGSPRDGGLGYVLEDLLALSNMLVPYGGLRDVGLQAGEKVVVAPATGTFGGAAVPVALAMGAREVVAMGRDEGKLALLSAQYGRRVRTVRIAGDAEAEAAALRGDTGPADVFLDLSPPSSGGSSHLTAGLLSLRRAGRASFMGGLAECASFPIRTVVSQALRLRGKTMYERADIAALVRLVEAGIVRLGAAGGITVAGRFGLEEFERAFECAARNNRAGSLTAIVP